MRSARRIVALRAEVLDGLREPEVRDERAKEVGDHGKKASHAGDGDKIAFLARIAREVGGEQREQAARHDGVVHAVGEALPHFHAGNHHAMSEGIPHLAVRGDQVHNVAHHAEQCHDKRRVHTRNHLRAEERHEDPDTRDADEKHPALPGRVEPEGVEDGVAELHRAHGEHADDQEDPNERSHRRTFGAEDVETGGHVVGQPLAKGDLPHEVGQDEGEGEGDRHRHASKLTPRVEGHDAATHELRKRRHDARKDSGDVGPSQARRIGHALEERRLRGRLALRRRPALSRSRHLSRCFPLRSRSHTLPFVHSSPFPCDLNHRAMHR